MKRISLMVKKDQYDSLSNDGINFSGLVRDLLDDYLSDHKITISVSEETRNLYDKIVSNTGTTDLDIEGFFREALKKLLDAKIIEMNKLKNEVFGD